MFIFCEFGLNFWEEGMPNGSIRKQYIYMMHNSRRPFLWKIGIANSADRRRQEVDNSTAGTVRVVTSCQLYFAYALEQIMHFIYAPLNQRVKGSGGTEWFFFLVPISPFLIIWTVYIVQEVLLKAWWVLLIVGVLYGLNEAGFMTSEPIK